MVCKYTSSHSWTNQAPQLFLKDCLRFSADTVTGPFSFVDVAIPTWSHNAAPIALKDGSFAIVHIGSGSGAAAGGANCTCMQQGPGWPPPPAGCPPAPPPPPPPPPPGPSKACTQQIPGYRCYVGRCAASVPCAGSHCECGPDITEPKLSCKGTEACAIAAATKCNATTGCEQFTQLAAATKLYPNTSQLVANSDWTAFVKIGSKADVQLAAAQQQQTTHVGSGSSIHVSKSLHGPWVPLAPNTLGSCNNPAPWVHKNGTIFIVCGGEMKRSQSISGPWTKVTTFSHAGGPPGNYEDPYLYTDSAGHFHLLCKIKSNLLVAFDDSIWVHFTALLVITDHVYTTEPADTCTNSTVSAHVFSEDGFTWHSHPVSPYGTHIAVSGGDDVVVSTRERPKLFFDEYGKMTHLFNGVCSAPACAGQAPCVNCKVFYWDYTLVAPLDV